MTIGLSGNMCVVHSAVISQLFSTVRRAHMPSLSSSSSFLGIVTTVVRRLSIDRRRSDLSAKILGIYNMGNLENVKKNRTQS